MATFNVTKRSFTRERKQVTSGAVVTLTSSVYLPALTAIEETTGNNAGVIQKRVAGAARIVIDSGSGNIHFTEDGTDPTTGVTNVDVGNIAGAGDIIFLESLDAIKQFKAIALAANAQLEVTYYR